MTAVFYPNPAQTFINTDKEDGFLSSFFLTEVYLIYSVVLVSGVQQSNSHAHTHPLHCRIVTTGLPGKSQNPSVLKHIFSKVEVILGREGAGG